MLRHWWQVAARGTAYVRSSSSVKATNCHVSAAVLLVALRHTAQYRSQQHHQHQRSTPRQQTTRHAQYKQGRRTDKQTLPLYKHANTQSAHDNRRDKHACKQRAFIHPANLRDNATSANNTLTATQQATTQTSEHKHSQQPLHDLNKKVRNAVRQITVSYNKMKNTYEATLVLDGTGKLVACGAGRSQKLAKRACAVHALRIFDELRSDTHKLARGTALQSDKAGAAQDSDVASVTTVAADEARSAPLSAVVASMGARRARLFRMASLLFDVPAPKIRFRKIDTQGCRRHSQHSCDKLNACRMRNVVYLCQLEWNGMTCEGKGLNRFEAERSALTHALTAAEVHDERMQALSNFLAQHTETDSAGVPTAELPSHLRERIAQCVADATPPSASKVDTTVSIVNEAASCTQMFTAQHAMACESKGSDTTAVIDGSYAQRMRDRLCALRADPDYLRYYHPRRCSLPMATVAERVVQTTELHRVTIICGTTGCGKTTQVPQYILDAEIMRGRGDCCNILVTQPRRLSTFGVAERIAQERLSRVGEDVGYVVRLEARPGRHVTLCTSGSLLQMLTSQPYLEHVTHLIIDEVHERDVNCDTILALTKQILQHNSKLRVILMSATMQADVFARYFDNAPVIEVDGAAYTVREHYLEDIARSAHVLHFRSSMFAVCSNEVEQEWQCKVLTQSGNSDTMQDNSASNSSTSSDCVHDDASEVSGVVASSAAVPSTPTSVSQRRKQHHRLLTPLKTDYDLIAYLVYYSVIYDLNGCVDDKSILVFLPGWRELLAAKLAIEEFAHGKHAETAVTMLSRLSSPASIVQRDAHGQPSLRFHVVLLHSSVDTAKQRECFARAPAGCVKIVLATNIAESGITIDDAAVVIDTGLLKQTEWACRPSTSSAFSSRYYGNKTTNGAHGSTSRSASAEDITDEATAGASLHHYTTQLSLGYASQANCTQRKGRAGRTQGGVCYRLFTRAVWQSLPPFAVAEVHRVALTQVLLRLLFLGYTTPRATLQQFLEPPAPANVEASMQQLQDLGAVDAHEQLTPLGKYLSQLPCDPRIGKLVMLGAMLHCLDSALTVAATTDASPFVSDRDATAAVRMKRYLFARSTESDHLSALNAYNAFCANGERRDFAVANSFHYNNLHIISRYKEQYHNILRASGFLSDSETNYDVTTEQDSGDATDTLAQAKASGQTSHEATTDAQRMCRAYSGNMYIDCSALSCAALDVSLVKACVCGSLFPNVAIHDTSAYATASQSRTRRTRLTLRTRTQRCITPAKESACRRIGGPAAAVLPTCAEYVRALVKEREAHSNDASSNAAEGARLPAMFYVYEDVFSVREAHESFLRGVSAVSMWALLLFGASEAKMRYYAQLGICVLDRWIVIRMSESTYTALHSLRATLDRCIWQKYVSPHDARNNATMRLLRDLSKEILRLPLDASRDASSRLVDSGVIISPTALAETFDTTSLTCNDNAGLSTELDNEADDDEEHEATASVTATFGI